MMESEEINTTQVRSDEMMHGIVFGGLVLAR